MYKEGMKVKINEEGFRKYSAFPSNPRDTVGIVVAFAPERDFDPDWYDVMWPDGEINAYENGTLDIVED